MPEGNLKVHTSELKKSAYNINVNNICKNMCQTDKDFTPQLPAGNLTHSPPLKLSLGYRPHHHSNRHFSNHVNPRPTSWCLFVLRQLDDIKGPFKMYVTGKVAGFFQT